MMPDILQEAPTEVISNDDCKNAWGSRSINPGHVCILSNDRDTSACMVRKKGPLSPTGNFLVAPRATMMISMRETDWKIDITSWAFCQILKIAGCACAGNAGNVFPATVS